MCVLDILWSLRDMLRLYGSHNKKRTVGSRSEKSLYGLNTSDGVDIAEVVGAHYVSCYESVHAFRRFPAQEWCTFQFDVVVIESFVKDISNPLCHLRNYTIDLAHSYQCSLKDFFKHTIYVIFGVLYYIVFWDYHKSGNVHCKNIS